MKPLYTIVAVLVTVTIVGMITISTQQVFAPRDCGQCAEFQKLTEDYLKGINDAKQAGNYDLIPGLAEEYSLNVKQLFESPSPTR